MKSILNFFADLFGHNVSEEAIIAKNSILFISRNHKEYPYISIIVAIGLVCLAIYLIRKYGGNNEPLRKVPEWVTLQLPNTSGTFFYDIKNFIKSKTFTWVDIGKAYEEPFDEFGSTFQVLQYRFNHIEKTFRLMTEIRYSDTATKKQKTYQKENQDPTWKPVTEPELLTIYNLFLNFKKNS